jgi:hypothetical protein
VDLVLHPGVRVTDGVATDVVRGVVIPLARDGAAPSTPEVALLAERCARLKLTWSDARPMLAGCVQRRSLLPLTTLKYTGRRIYPRPGLLAVLPGALAATARPAVLTGLFLAVVATVAGLAVGDVGTPLRAAGAGAAVWWMSYAAHEAAHLWWVRVLSRDRSRGAFEVSWLQVCTVAPPMKGARGRVVAFCGPVAGAAACTVLAFTDVAAWLCVLGVVAHLGNLLPFAPDGKMLAAWTNR